MARIPTRRPGTREARGYSCQKAPRGESPLSSLAAEVEALNLALRRIHLGVLAGLVCSAILVALEPPTEAPTGPFPGYSLAALLVACVSIFTRREPRRPIGDVRPILRRTLIGIALAGLLGPLGVLIALLEGAHTTGLLYVLAGAFLSLRPPPEVVHREGRPDRFLS